jgi:hypothetical protein
VTLTIRPFDGRLCHVATAEVLTERRQVLRVSLFSMTFWRRTGPRLVALLLAAVVCADITLDAACDPIALPGAESSVPAFSVDTGTGDACGDTCVADCFCCSRSETAGPALILPSLTELAQAPSPSPASVPTVVRPVAEPPPLALS